jgi:hypothetical protein
VNKRNQFVLLGVLVAILAATAYFTFRRSSASADAAPSAKIDEKFVPLNVDNPALRMDILQRFLALQYKGVHRSIFSATLPPPPAPPTPPQPVNVVPAAPAGPPPLTVDAKYFGFVTDFGGNHKRAFFATGNGPNEEIVIAGEGDTLLGRFRVIRLTNTTADVEEVASGRRATLTLEEPPPNGNG